LPLLEAEGLGRPAVLKKWRKAGAHSALHRLDRFDLTAAAWKELLAGVDALGAEALVLSTPPSFSPSAANREAMTRNLGEAAAELAGRVIAWEPRGTWEPAQAARLCQELGLVHARDPLIPEVLGHEPAPPAEEDQVYFRIHALGLQRNRLSDEHLAELAARVAQHARAWVVFANVERYRDAQRFLALWTTFAAESE
jgi:uncharacterized protein YecE (DUF72 family)